MVALLTTMNTSRSCSAFLVSSPQQQHAALQQQQRPSLTVRRTTTSASSSRRLHLSTREQQQAETAAAAVDPAVPVSAENSNADDVEYESESESEYYLSQLQRTSIMLGTRLDDRRLAVPAYERGEIDRLFSAVEYSEEEDDDDNDNSSAVLVRHAPGSLLGAAALIAGTTTGAGVLALPAATASAGFVPSTAALLAAWAAMTMSGLLIAELSLNRMAQTGQPGRGLLDLLQSSFGSTSDSDSASDDNNNNNNSSASAAPLQALGTAAYFFLHYAVMVAYMAQGGTNIETILSGTNLGGGTTIVPGPVAFAAITGTALYAASTRTVQWANNALVAVVAASFAGILALGAPAADWNSLVDPAQQHPAAVVSCVPILVLSLVYQSVVPTVVAQLEGNRRKITRAIVLGTAAPLLLFVAWNAVILGNVNVVAEAADVVSSGGGSGSFDPVALLQQQTTTSCEATAATTQQLLGPLVTAFSTTALVTSVIGFTYGLLDAWTDVFRMDANSREYEQKWKLPLFGLVFGPPVLLSLLNQDIFYTALEYGGAFGVSTLFLLLPALMVWNQRYGQPPQHETTAKTVVTQPLVPLGKVSLAGLAAVAVGLVGQQGADKLGQLWLQM